MARVLGKPQTSLNPYESFRDINQDNDWYDAERWNIAAREGRLAMEADIIRRGDSELGAYADYVDRYHLDRASNDMFYAAVSKDLYADDTEIKDWEEEVLNPDTNEYETKKYQMTEKQWIEHQLQNWIDYDNYMIEQELKEEEKANRPWIVKALAGVADVGGSFLKGGLDTIEGASRLLYSLIDASGSAVFQGKNWGDVFREDMSGPYEGSENVERFEDEVLNLDDWSILRDANGNYTTLGTYLSQITYTLGQMAPTMIANAVLPGIGTLGVYTSTVPGVASSVSKAVGRGTMAFYYTAMWSNRTTERFQNPDFASTPTWLIMLDSTIKTTTDILIEQGLRIFTGKIFGSSSTIDRLMYGAGVKGTATGIAKAASKLGTLGRVGYRIARDFVSEGVEEVLQDVFANISSQIEGLFYDSFNTDEITPQSLLDTFVIAGLASVFMTGANIAFTNRVDLDDEGHKLGKLQSWLYISDYQNLADFYDELLTKDLTTEERAKVMDSMRAAFNVTASVFRGLGEERVKQASELFTKVRDHYNMVQQKEKALNVLSTDERLRTLSETQRYKETSIKYADAVMKSLDKLGSDYAKTKLNKKTLFKRLKNKDGTTKRQTVAEKLADADVTQVHDFIAKTDINDIQPQEGRSEKRTRLAQKVANELNKDVAYTDGHNTVNAGDVQLIPGEYADTHEDAEVLRTIAENEFIDTLVSRLDKRILDRIRNWWRVVQKDKRKGTYEDAVRALLFNDDFFAVSFATANQEMYQFITHIRDVLSESHGTKVSDLMYEKIIEDVLKRYKPIICEFVINQQNADLNQLQDFFTEPELKDIVKNRWSFELTNRILDNNQYNKLSEADNRVIENRINYLQADNTIKEQIRKDLKSSSVNVRIRAMRMLDNEYNNLFFSKYNDRIYFEPTSPARNYFNQLMQNLGINLLEIRTGRFSKQFTDRMSKVLDANGNSYTDPIQFLQDQFGQFTENGFAFEKRGNDIVVYQTNITNNEVYTAGSMEYYNDLFGMMQMTMNDETGVLVEPSRDRATMKKFLTRITDGAKVNNVNLAFTSINDIVQRPQDYLTTEHLMNIREDYRDVNNYTTFQYLRDLLLDEYETLTLVRYENGQVLFADMTDAYSALLPSIANMSKNTNTIFEKYVGKGPIAIEKFFDKARLSPLLEGYTVEFVRDKSGNAGTHNPQTRTIVINNSKNNAFTRFALLHEFQHAIQNVNRLAGGLSPYFIVSDALLQDFEKNLPQLFAENASVESKKDSIRWFLYKTASGEIDANLFSDSVAFMGTLIRGTVGNQTHIITPWGTEHDIIVKEQGQALELPDNEYVNNINTLTSRPIDRLDEQPGQEQKHQPKAKQRVKTSKRGAHKRDNSERTYVSKAASKGTNLASFAGRRIPLDMQGFINEASATRLPGELWEKIENGTLNYYDVHRYFRTHHDLDEYTFQLIRKYFFPNSWFKTNDQLRRFTDLDLAFYYALQGVLYEAGFELDASKPMSFNNFMKLYEQISQNPSFKDRLDTKATHFLETKVFNKQTKKFEYQALDIDQNHLRVAAMEMMDGSIDSAAHIIALARSIALSYRYHEVWNTADIKKLKSLQDTTSGHKADDAESGTLEDVIADVKSSQDMMTQALEEKIATSDYAQKIELLFEYYGDKLRRKNPDYKNWSEQKQRKAVQVIKNKIDSLTPEQFDNMYRKIVAKQMGVNFTETAIENNNVAKPVDKRKNIIASIKRFATTIKNYRSADQWKRVPDDYKQYFDEDGNLKQEYYARIELKPDANGNYPKLQEMQTKLGALAQGLRRGDFTTKIAANAFQQAQKYKQLYKKQKETNQKLKNRYALVSDNKNFIIQSNSREFKATANIAMPDKLRKMFDTEFEDTRQSTIKYIAKPDDKRQIFNQKHFYEVNADILTNLTSDDVEEIIRFYDSAVLLEAEQESMDKFRAFKIYLLAYFIDEARSGRWNIDSYYLERAEDILTTVTSSARELAVWRSVLYKINPNKVITQALAKRLGVELDEGDVDNLTEATKTGDVKKILRAQRELVRNTLYRYKTIADEPTKNKKAVDKITKKLVGEAGVDINDIISNPEKYFDNAQMKTIREEYGNNKSDVFHYVQDFVIDNTHEIALTQKDGKFIFVDFTSDKSTFMNKLLTFQKAAMLSSPATAIRNQISNVFIEQGSKAAEVFGKAFAKPIEKTDAWIRKLIKRPHGELAIEQIDIIGVKVTDDVKNFIQTQVIDAGVFEFISEGASKYDTRKSKTYTGMDALTDMVVNNIINEITRGNTYNSDVMNAVIQQVFSWQSDSRFINRTAKRYLGKLLTAQNVDLSRGLSEEVMTNIAEAYKLAAFDYMHKTNVISELENKLRERAPKVYAGYKMIFPFIPTSWNWFVESINWSPVGLVKNIVQLCRLEKTVDKLLLDRQRGRQTYDPRLAKYVITRNVGKGVMGSLLMGLGMLLGGLGVFQVDDDDDKLKIKIGDVYFNINNIFGTSSIILGAELMNPRQGSISEVLEAAFGAITEDAWLNDIANMFSYGADSVWDVLLDKPTDILGTFVPNFLKSLNKLFYTHEVKYDSGFLGNLEYLAASSIPFLAYAFPKKIDPFTGEVQSKYGLPFIWDFLVDLINVASPMRVKPHVVSEQERVAIELGLNKQPLTGKYDDIGQVDYTTLNMKYGSLNQADLIKLLNNQVKYTVEDEDGKRRDKYWRQMTEEQKKTVVERIMSNNSRYAKIYTWTQAGHKYYASNSEYTTLKKLGITKNIFKGDKGFVA